MKKMFFSNGEVHEIRAFRGKEVKTLVSHDPTQLAEWAQKLDTDGYNVYVTLNPVKKSTKTAKDADILERHYILLDLDPERPANTMATQLQRKAAQEISENILTWLTLHKIQDVSLADSGNGTHLLLPVLLPNTQESTALVRDIISYVAYLFNDANKGIHIDPCVYNAARITRFYGTLNRKGNDPSLFTDAYEWSQETAQSNTQALKKLLAEKQNATPDYQNLQKKLDYAKSELEKRNLDFRIETTPDGYKLPLRHCPWESNHTTESHEYESCIFINFNGLITFSCFHAHCSTKTWKDLLSIPEPKPQPSQYPWGTTTSSFTTLADWLSSHSSDNFANLIPTKFSGIDRYLHGLLPGDLTILAGETSQGKTTFATSVALNLLEQNKRVAYFANESQNQVVEKFFLGASNSSERKNGQFGFFVPLENKPQVASRLSNLLLHTDTTEGEKILKNLYTLGGADIVVIDNLMSTTLDEQGDIYVSQKLFCLAVKQAATAMNFHAIIVAHMNKTEKGLPRITNIFGSSNIANVSDNILIIHRGGTDFENRVKSMQKAGATLPVPLACDAYAEVCKNKHFGTLGWSILAYDASTGRIIDTTDTPTTDDDLKKIIRI